MAESPLLEVTDLSVDFGSGTGRRSAVAGLSFSVARGSTLAIVGESGSGKSSTVSAVTGLLRHGGARVRGSVRFEGQELVTASEQQLRRLRGSAIATVFQDTASALHPYFTVGAQVSEAYRAHHRVSRAAARRRVVEVLDLVGLPDPHRAVRRYPHEYSGGMRQRALIAMAVVNEPALLLADEPTASLDPTVRDEILDLLGDLRRELAMAMVLVTHDMAVVGRTADEVLVTYAGRAVEHGRVEQVLTRPAMPYTQMLLACQPDLTWDPTRDWVSIPGQPPGAEEIAGCAFHPRCPRREEVPGDRCVTVLPRLLPVVDSGPSAHHEHAHLKRCHLGEVPDGAER